MNLDLQTRDITPLRHTYAHVARYIGGDKNASRYQEAILGAQPAANFHYRPTWDPAHELFDTSRSAIRLADWYALRDPRQFYYATWAMTRARQQDAIESNFTFVESRGLAARMGDELREQVLRVLLPLRHAAWGANMNNAAIGAYGYGTSFTAPAMFHAMDNLGVAQYLTRLGLTLAEPEVLDEAKQAWLEDATWQGLRRYQEDSFIVHDPFELFVAQNLALDGLLYPLVYGGYVDDEVTLQGGTAVGMMTAFMPEWADESARWIDAVVKVAAAESDANRQQLRHWLRTWSDRAYAALEPMAQLAVGAKAPALLEEARQAVQARAAKAGLDLAA